MGSREADIFELCHMDLRGCGENEAKEDSCVSFFLAKVTGGQWRATESEKG